MDRRAKKRKKHDVPKKKMSVVDDEISDLQTRYNQIDAVEVNSFEDFPLSKATLEGLYEGGYTVPTKIQKETIGLALRKFDILGAAKTGSGKTLAFLIPLLEHLFCSKWTKFDGVGALIITPTRELALQIFETLRKIGRYHDFSAGLIIGGKDLKFEKNRMSCVNVVVCTPGRLLQHMDENPLFNCDNLKILILDEADRCLDMGFESSMNAIIANLPVQRQTLLFSATQTRRVRDLARLSLKDPKFISVHEHDKHKTPEDLAQSYIVCEQHDKITVLWSFIMNHLRSKILVFFSTCHQVRYVHEVFKQLHPRITLLSLHGKMHQLKRIDVYDAFCKKKHAVLFATDIAARGLDFPEVHWVVQIDCPEDVETYIHRAGRTARYHKGGESLLILRPSETSITDNLISAKIPINQIKVNPAKMFSPLAKIEALLAKEVTYKEMAQRAFVSYVKSVFLMKDKSIFDVKSIDLAQFAKSLGLVVCPRVRFLKKHLMTNEDNDRPESEKSMTATEDYEDPSINNEYNDTENDKSDEDETMQELQSKDQKKENFEFGLDDDNDDILTIKRRNHELPDDLAGLDEAESKRKAKKVNPHALAKKILKKKLVVNSKFSFNEDGEVVKDVRREKVTDVGKMYELNNEEGGIDIEEAINVMKEEDKSDTVLFRERLKAKRKELKLKKKEELGRLRRKQGDYPEEEEEEEDEDSDTSGPDLSWLPDPDKLYGKQHTDKSSDSGVDDEDEEEQKMPKKKPKITEDSDSESGDDALLRDEEEFALHLLSKDK